jgi:glutathione synthase
MAPRSLYLSPYPPQLTSEQQGYLLSTVKEWSITHGLVVLSPSANSVKDPKAGYTGIIPITLFPSQFPTDCFQEALEIQTAYNKLYAAVASDEAWLGQVVEE